MTNREVKEIMYHKGVRHLYHANSMITSVTFLTNGGLLSRGAVRDRGLRQTPQMSDELDQRFGLFYDIFFDSGDGHAVTGRLSHYGPVMFVYSLDVLDAVPEHSLKITRDNPVHWRDDITEAEKYFLTVQALNAGYEAGNLRHQLTIVDQREALTFDYLEKIILDNPELDDADDNALIAQAGTDLERLLDRYGIRVPVERRQCPDSCQCRSLYNGYRKGAVYHRFSGYRLPR